MSDVLNSLISAGFVECSPFREVVPLEEVASTLFEVNPSYVHEIKLACRRC